jgi:hypothetical protein
MSADPSSARQGQLARLLHVLGGRFALLFFFLLGSIAVYPYAESSAVGFYGFRILGALVILLTVYAVTFSRGLFVLVVLLAIPSTLHQVVLPAHALGPVALFSRSVSLVFNILVIALIFQHVFQTDKPDSETIFGALCVYLLLGFLFAGFYAAIDRYTDHAFYMAPATNRHLRPDRFDFIYFSFGTMTELGTPGMTAVAPVARSLSLIEAISGILYLAVLISRLLSAYRAAEERKELRRLAAAAGIPPRDSA